MSSGLDQNDADDIGRLEQRALRMLVTREHSRGELNRKLRMKGADPKLVEKVLDGLQSSLALSDRRFVEAYVTARSGKGFGPKRIHAELGERGVVPELIEEYLDETDPIWELALRRVEVRRFGAQPAKNYREWSQRARFLAHRGFPSESIRRLVKSS